MGRKKAALAGQLADIDFRLLRVFKTVVESGGFTSAELELNLANSTITNYISDLEKRLDMRLCDRGRSGFQVTEQGQIVYQATLQLLDAVEQFRYKVNRSHNRILGNLHLGFAEHMLGVPNAFLTEALDQFSQRAPEVKIRVTTLGSEEAISELLNNKVDIAVTVSSRPHPELNSLQLFTEQMRLYCAESHPFYSQADDSNHEALRQYRFVESPRLLPGREIHPDVHQWNIQAKAHHQEARASLILSGHYVGFLPQHLVQSWGLSDQLKPLFCERYSYTNVFHAFWRESHQSQDIIQLFTDCLSVAAK